MTARFSALVALLTCLLATSSALAQSVVGETMNGSDTLNIRLKGDTSFNIRGPNVEVSFLDVDDLGNGTYSTAFDIDGTPPPEPLDFDVTIDSSGKREVLLIDDLTQIETDLAAIILAHNRRYRNVTVTIDPSTVKTKLKAKSNITLDAKILIDLKFTATTALAGYENMTGKLELRPRVTATLPGACSVCGGTFDGESTIESLLDRCGTLQAATSDATLVIDPDVDDDGSSTFTMTDALGNVLLGQIGQAGKRLTCAVGTPGQELLLTDIESQIVEECPDLLEELDTPSLDARLRFLTCTGKTDKNASSVSIDFFMNFRTLTVPEDPEQAARQGPSGTTTIEGGFERSP